MIVADVLVRLFSLIFILIILDITVSDFSPLRFSVAVHNLAVLSLSSNS